MKVQPPLVLTLCAALWSAHAGAQAFLSGEQAFAACAACHSLAPGAPHRVGPNLHGVVGSAAASRPDYAYSPALAESGIRWSREYLFAWIAGSEHLVPGSWMLYDNILRPEEVQALINYLERGAAPKP